MAEERASTQQRQAAPAAVRGMPHSVEAEEYLLSCCLIDGADVVARCLEARISPASFYVSAHGVIFERLQDLYSRQVPIDVAVLAEELKTARQLESVGGYAFLTRVSGSIPTTAQAGYFIERVREQHLLREIIRTTTGAAEECFNFTGGIDEFVDQVEARIFAVTQSRVNEGAKPMKEPTREAMNIINLMMMKKGEMTGVPSGFKELDSLTFGFQRQEMIVLAARPSMGKTSFALNIAEAAVFPRRGDAFGTLIFSLEMSASQLALRMLCSRARINMKLLRDGLLPKNSDDHSRLVGVA
ncbi:MAG TPA: DnaB-like helicase C-terminal domain-containing protein, partial [Elusimicrobiota bacterium]|nr:DnaB-like helicase C-terminal domain-containing protein [Elusimicrobiota bacterium]